MVVTRRKTFFVRALTGELVATFLLIRKYLLPLKRVSGRVLATTRLDCVVRLVRLAGRILAVLATTRLRLVVAVACLGYTLGLLTVLLERLTIFLGGE